MKFNAGTRTRIRASLELDFDPTGSDIELRVDGTWWPATWEGASVEDAATGKWKQSARTIGYFAGPEADQSGATPLTGGRHATEVRITSGVDIITGDAEPIDVA